MSENPKREFEDFQGKITLPPTPKKDPDDKSQDEQDHTAKMRALETKRAIQLLEEKAIDILGKKQDTEE